MTLIGTVYGCGELFEEDLSDVNIEIEFPTDSTTVNEGQTQFKWKNVESALTYEFQLVRGTFGEPVSFIVDTILSTEDFEAFLGSGSYEWSLKAQNESSESNTYVQALMVDSNFSLADQSVQLLSPHDICINDSSIILQWSPLPIEVEYQVDLRRSPFSGNVLLAAFETSLSSIEIQLSNSFEGELSWGVRAINDAGATPFSFNNFFLDITAPESPTPLEPLDGDTVTSPFLIRWEHQPDNGCDIIDSLLVYADSSLSDLKRSYGMVENESKTVSLEAGVFWWVVKTYDQAGNQSQLSNINKFSVD